MLNSHHLSDDEKAEALKRWWGENGKSIVGGIVIGLALVFSWRWWLGYQQTQSEMASAEYDRFIAATTQGNVDAATAQLTLLGKDYSTTAYDYFAALEMARLMVEQNNLQAAADHLQTAVAAADQDGLRQLAEIRLARVLMALDRNDEARSIVAANSKGAFAGEFAHISGDLYRAGGDNEQALAAYQQAIAGGAGNQSLIEMKINQVR